MEFPEYPYGPYVVKAVFLFIPCYKDNRTLLVIPIMKFFVKDQSEASSISCRFAQQQLIIEMMQPQIILFMGQKIEIFLKMIKINSD